MAGIPPYTGGGDPALAEKRYQEQRQNERYADQQNRFRWFQDQMGTMGAAPDLPGAPTVSRVTGAIADAEGGANSAAFGAAKDMAGMNAQAALTALRGQLGMRGMGGGGYEAGNIGAILGQAANSTGDVIRDQATQKYQSAQHNADLEHSGQITQRGQDYQRQEAQARLQLEAKMRAQQNLQMALQGLSRVY